MLVKIHDSHSVLWHQTKASATPILWKNMCKASDLHERSLQGVSFLRLQSSSSSSSRAFCISTATLHRGSLTGMSHISIAAKRVLGMRKVPDLTAGKLHGEFRLTQMIEFVVSVASSDTCLLCKERPQVEHLRYFCSLRCSRKAKQNAPQLLELASHHDDYNSGKFPSTSF